MQQPIANKFLTLSDYEDFSSFVKERGSKISPLEIDAEFNEEDQHFLVHAAFKEILTSLLETMDANTVLDVFSDRFGGQPLL